MALETTSVLTRFGEQEAAQIIEGIFHQGIMSVGWKSGPGPGKINKIHRNHGNNFFWTLIGMFFADSYESAKLTTTMAIDITPEPNGVVRVDMWTSNYSKASLGGSVGAIVRAKQRIGQALAEPDTPQLAEQMYGSQASIPLGQQGNPGGFPLAGRPRQQRQPYDRWN